jgi:acyl-CoA thioesterase-1
MLKRLLFIPLLLWCFMAQAADSSSSATLLVLGDSISGAYGINTNEGWVALLQQRLTQKGFNYHVVNASVSGDTTRTGLNRLDDALQQHQPYIVIVALGGNDGLRGLPFSEIEASLTSIIQRCQQYGAQVLLTGVRLPPNYGAFYNTRFATLFQQLSDTYQVSLVPKLLDQVADHRDLMQPDGIHPTAAAQPQILENVWPHLQPLLSAQQASH